MKDYANISALKIAQAAYDNMTPPEDDGREDYIVAKVDEMIETGECDLVPFFTKTNGIAVEGFDVAGSEAICEADTKDCELLQLVLACLNGEHDRAAKLAKHFEQPLRDAAAKLVEKEMERDE